MSYDGCDKRRRDMKNVAAILLAVLLAASLAGCGSGTSAQDTLSILMQTTSAMLGVSGYRMAGNINMDWGAGISGGQGQPVNMEIRAEVQNADGEMRQHMVATLGDYEVEAYIIGDVYYQYMPGQGWMKMSTGAYQTQNMSMGFVDAAQMETMMQMAKDAEVIEENDETIAVAFRLDEEYLQASLELYRKYIAEGDEQISEEWLQMAEEAISEFKAEIRIWISKADDLIQRMEMEYTMGGQSEVGKMSDTAIREVDERNREVEHHRSPLLMLFAFIAAIGCVLGAWIILEGRTNPDPSSTRSSGAQMDPIYRLERDPIGMSFWEYETALPGDLAEEQTTDVTGPTSPAKTFVVRATVPTGASDDGFRGTVQRLDLVPGTAVRIESGERDLDAFLLAALGGATSGPGVPDALASVEGVRVAQREYGWGLSDYVWYRDGALFVYHGGPEWGYPLLATWFAHPELVAVAE
jgi:hypothetical protein